jgi:hypothetical protein
MEARINRHSIREFVESLAPGTTVVWIANGQTGTVQPDKTILWSDGHHMTHRQMNDSHALLIHSEAEKKHLQETLANRLKCLKRDCTLVQWDATKCKEKVTECLCPLGVLSEPEIPSVIGRRKHLMKSTRASSTAPGARAASPSRSSVLSRPEPVKPGHFPRTA